MFSSRLNAFRPTLSTPTNGHVEWSDRSAFFHPSRTAATLHISHSLPSFSTAAALRAHSNARNFYPFMTLLHDPLYTPAGGSVLAACPSFAPSQDGISFDFRLLAPILDQPSTAIPFRIRTYVKLAHNPFRIRTYKKTRGGVEAPAPPSRSSVVHLRASRSILGAAL